MQMPRFRIFRDIDPRPALYSFVVLCAAMLLHPHPGKRVLLELTLYAVVIVTLWRIDGFRNIFLGLTGFRRIFILCFFAAMLLGQVLENHNRTYPFPYWAMYTSPHPSATFNQYIVTYASNKSGLLPVRELVPVTSPRAFLSRLNQQAKKLHNPKSSPEQVAAAESFLRIRLREVIQTYNARFPKDPIRSIRIVRRTIPIKAYKGLESISADTLLYVEQ
jgi:hypothetical protein